MLSGLKSVDVQDPVEVIQAALDSNNNEDPVIVEENKQSGTNNGEAMVEDPGVVGVKKTKGEHILWLTIKFSVKIFFFSFF